MVKASSSGAISSSSTVAKKTMAKTAPAKARTQALFAPGAEVEVRRRFTQAAIVSSCAGAEREVVIYAGATVVSASAGTASYLVQHPAAGRLPSRVARVPASDVRGPRRRLVLLLPPPAAAAPARPVTSGSNSKRTQQPDQRGGDDGCRKKRATSGRGIPMDALLRFFEEHEREDAKKKRKARHRTQAGSCCIISTSKTPLFLSSSLPAGKNKLRHYYLV